MNTHIRAVGGHDALDGDVTGSQATSGLLTRQGVTAWAPPLVAAAMDAIRAALAAIREAQHS